MSNFIFDPSTKFLDPERLLFGTGLGPGQTFVDLGSGSGFYTLAAGKIVGEQGLVYSVDILESALDHVAAETRMKGLRNIKTLLADLEAEGSCPQIPTGSADMVLFANLLHQIKNSANLFGEAYRLLKTGGKLVVIEWNDQPGPLGPSVEDRISSTQTTRLAQKSAFKSAGTINTDPYHYGLIFIK
jgi:ubiquinone/menaquinone biosynthesis C-methylase UbiE